MPLPPKALRETEDVLLDTRPSWTALVRPVTVGVVVLAACVTGIVAWGSAPAWFGALLLVLLLLAAGHVGWQVLRWRSTAIAVTTNRVVYRTGVLRRYGREVPIESVQDVSYHQGLFERLARAGSVTVESAGDRGTLPFVDVPHPERFQAAVNGAISEARGRSRAVAAGWAPGGAWSGGSGSPGGPGWSGDAEWSGGAGRAPTIPEQIAQLAELHARGVLTDGEFARAKADLLGRM